MKTQINSAPIAHIEHKEVINATRFMHLFATILIIVIITVTAITSFIALDLKNKIDQKQLKINTVNSSVKAP